MTKPPVAINDAQSVDLFRNAGQMLIKPIHIIPLTIVTSSYLNPSFFVNASYILHTNK